MSNTSDYWISMSRKDGMIDKTTPELDRKRIQKKN